MTRSTTIALVALVTLAVPLAAQPPSTAQAPATVMKNKAPVSKEILKVTLPKPQEADLANGVHLMVLEDHRAPIVNFLLIIEGAGGYYDPADTPGLAGFVATLMREGTESKTSEQISSQLDRLAATVVVTAGISSPFATVSGSALSDTVDTVLATTADVVVHPAFAQAEVDRFKARTQATLMNQRSQPSFLASERFQRVVFGDHPAESD